MNFFANTWEMNNQAYKLSLVKLRMMSQEVELRVPFSGTNHRVANDVQHCCHFDAGLLCNVRYVTPFVSDCNRSIA